MEDQFNLEMKIIANALMSDCIVFQDGHHFNNFLENGWKHLFMELKV